MHLTNFTDSGIVLQSYLSVIFSFFSFSSRHFSLYHFPYYPTTLQTRAMLNTMEDSIEFPLNVEGPKCTFWDLSKIMNFAGFQK